MSLEIITSGWFYVHDSGYISGEIFGCCSSLCKVQVIMKLKNRNRKRFTLHYITGFTLNSFSAVIFNYNNINRMLLFQ